MSTPEMIAKLRAMTFALGGSPKARAFLNDIADRLETLHKTAVPLEELEDCFPVVLFLTTEAERQDLMAAVQEANPNLVAKQL